MADVDRAAAALEARLKERARALAARRREVRARAPLAHVVAVRRGGELLGFPIAAVHEVRRVSAIPLPHASGAVAGLFPVRGETCCLVDPLVLVGAAPSAPPAGETLAIVVSGKPGKVGLRIDDMVGPRVVYADEVAADLAQAKHDFVAAVTRDLLAIVDVDALFARPEIVMDAPA